MHCESDTLKRSETIQKQKNYFNQRSNLGHRVRSYIISLMFRSSPRRQFHKFDINMLCSHALLPSYRDCYDKLHRINYKVIKIKFAKQSRFQCFDDAHTLKF